MWTCLRSDKVSGNVYTSASQSSNFGIPLNICLLYKIYLPQIGFICQVFLYWFIHVSSCYLSEIRYFLAIQQSFPFTDVYCVNRKKIHNNDNVRVRVPCEHETLFERIYDIQETSWVTCQRFMHVKFTFCNQRVKAEQTDLFQLPRAVFLFWGQSNKTVNFVFTN